MKKSKHAKKRTPRMVGPSTVPSLVTTEAASTGRAGRVAGQIVQVDRFGNLITNIRSAELIALGGAVVVGVGDLHLTLSGTYADVEVGESLAVIGSEGWLEIAVRDGSALDVLALGQGTAVVVSAGTT